MLVTCHTVVPQAITRHKDQPDVLEQGIGCTAVVCLRAPEHAEKLAEMGIIPIIAQVNPAMAGHSAHDAYIPLCLFGAGHEAAPHGSWSSATVLPGGSQPSEQEERVN